MISRSSFRLAVLTGIAFTFALASTATAVPTDHLYGDFIGTNFDFLDTKETVQTADDDPNPLFGAPSLSGDSLLFSPTSFIADSFNGVGFSDFDQTHSLLNATIMSTSTFDIEHIILNEGGDITLSDILGGSSSVTQVQAFMSGTVQIVESSNNGDIGSIITFGGNTDDFQAFFNIGNGIDNTTLKKSLQPTGAFSWTGTVDIDVASLYPGATKVELQWDNILYANSDAGTSSLIQKKAGSTGIVVTGAVPEPGAALLFSVSLVIAGLAARRRRSA
jgi:hypothetical protein